MLNVLGMTSKVVVPLYGGEYGVSERRIRICDQGDCYYCQIWWPMSVRKDAGAHIEKPSSKTGRLLISCRLGLASLAAGADNDPLKLLMNNRGFAMSVKL